jgi:RNA polymerase sigma-70 factor (ECF subfamily)
MNLVEGSLPMWRGPFGTSPMVNETLITRCLREEPKAQYELYRAMHGQMMSICSRYERNKQDAVARMNQGFLKILTNLDKRRPEVPFELWARRIMINTVIDEYRKDRPRKAQESLDASLDESTLVEVNDYLRHMEADAFAGLLQRVPDMSHARQVLQQAIAQLAGQHAVKTAIR